MSGTNRCSCNRETSSPFVDVPPLDDSETLITVIRSHNQLVRNDGAFVVAVAAFRREDLKKPGKSVSLMREDFVPPSELLRRAKALSGQGWSNDPVVAHASARALRSIACGKFMKCTCVYADPTTGEPDNPDPLGACCGHASLTSHCGFVGENADKVAYLNVISDIAECFGVPVHLVSSNQVQPTP